MIESRALLLSVAVERFRISLATALASGAILAGVLCAQVGEHKRREPTSETETSATPSPKPKKSPTPAAKAKAGNHAPSASPYANARAEISEKEVGQRSIRQICKIKVRSKTRGNAKAEKNTAAASRKRAHHGRDRKPATTGDCCTNTGALATTSGSARRFSAWASAGCHRKIRHRGGPGIGTSAITAAAPIRFVAVESSSHLPLPDKLRN